MSAKGLIVGIDLGTTYSLCGVLNAGVPVLIPNALGELLTPSTVHVDASGTILVGAAARARASADPANTAMFFKRDMGTDQRYLLRGRSFTPEELSAAVLRQLVADAESYLGQRVEEAVVTVPAYFGDRQRQATRAAAEIAGIKVERIINEPTAAALAYGLHNRDREARVVVLDLGGGTFDVTVLEIIEGVIEVQSSAGDARLGGEDFADAMVEHVRQRLKKEQAIELSESVEQARLREAVDRAKLALSDETEATLVLPRLGTSGGPVDVTMDITRHEAEVVWQELLGRLRAPIARALLDARVQPGEVDELLVVGGATRMPCFLRLAAQTFGRMPQRHLPPDEAVAMGAAIQAALKARDAAVSDLVVTDVAPFTLGIAIARRLGRQRITGVFAPIIERGTVIPVSRVETFSTMEDDQTRILIEVFQGEHSMTGKNQKLGEYEIQGLPKAPAGRCSVDVRFTYDLNGILEVEMSVRDTGRVEHLVLEQRRGLLRPEQIAAAREAMARLKFHPREALPNRTALERADALYGQLSGEPRAVLGDEIARFRASLEHQDTELANEGRERLIAVCQQLRAGDMR